jgi:hypothetical protein
MERVVVEPQMRAQLQDGKRSLELCDDTGQTMGFFLPAAEFLHWQYEWARRNYSSDELDRREQESGGRTTAEVLARLKQTAR